MKKISVFLLLILPLAFTSCLKDNAEPELIICPIEPTFINKWVQISSSENRYDNDGEKIKETIVEFNQEDEKAIKIELFEPKAEEPKDNEEEYRAEGKYIAQVFDEETQQVKTIEDIYKLLAYYNNSSYPVFEFHNGEKSASFSPKIEQNEKGTILTLTNQTFEGEGTDKVLIETILSFHSIY